ncbi:MAG: sugar transferase [Pseudomonadota bacterium]|nr:sugar transferase [Pseudomonadota bacterium]MDE3038199.1 sugar transferase [Pseudomonadota bacterium]
MRIKRGLDVIISGTAIVLLLPVFLLLAIIICLESPGPPVFAQQRIGLHGRPFVMFKFRSMVKDAPLLGAWHTAKNDPRITRVGRFIRVTSLDELPQLWNVFIGDMSLIGPRPEVPLQESLYQPADWRLRHRVRPGVTGLAQVSGRSDISEGDRLRHDLAYAAHPTFAGDMHILLKTISVVFRKAGVN